MYKIAVIGGDGIGPEIVTEGKNVLEAAGERFNFDIEWTDFAIGADRYLATGKLLTEDNLEDLRKFQKLSMDEETKLHCMGILKGIYKFEIDATTEFKDWSGDDPHVYFLQVLEEWEKGNRDIHNSDEMHLFIKKNCAKWH